MVESDGIGKSTSGEPGTGEAAQALRAILQTQYLRYMIIGTWALDCWRPSASQARPCGSSAPSPPELFAVRSRSG